ncbi:hypothetical protein TRVL_00935 [Trypanosoma vivax]|nr:hypothetical protein TRVL_00935 [Trypanosoma vivax]
MEDVNTQSAMAVELAGWAHVTNQLLFDAARRAITETQEPSCRAALLVEYANTYLTLVHNHAEGVSSFCKSVQLHRTVESERRAQDPAYTPGSDSGTQSKHECCANQVGGGHSPRAASLDDVRCRLDGIYAQQRGEEQRLLAAQEQVAQLADVLIPRNYVCPSTPPSDGDIGRRVEHSLDGLVAHLRTTQKTQTQLLEEIAMLRMQLSEVGQHEFTVSHRHQLMSPGSRTAAARMHGADGRLPEPCPEALYSPCSAFRSPTGLFNHEKAPAYGAISPSLGRSAPSPSLTNFAYAWKERMLRLKAELQDLRREIAN